MKVFPVLDRVLQQCKDFPVKFGIPIESKVGKFSFRNNSYFMTFHFGLISVNSAYMILCFIVKCAQLISLRLHFTEGNGPSKSVSYNPNKIICYSKIWISAMKMNIFWIIQLCRVARNPFSKCLYPSKNIQFQAIYGM